MANAKIICIFALALLSAAGPSTAPIRGIDGVEDQYNHAIAAGIHGYEKQLEEAKNQRVKNLHSLLDVALKNKDVDQVVAIKKLIDAEPPPSLHSNGMLAMEERHELELHLADTVWQGAGGNGESLWTLKSDGSTAKTNDAAGKWAAIDSKTIILIDNNGYVNKWEFNEHLSAFRCTTGHIEAHWDGVRAD
jgi:hypothetical protein